MPLKVRRSDPPSVNLTPMIDIVFLLIIFFMVGTKFSELERKIGLKIPTVSTATALTPAPEKKVVYVHRDGRISMDKQEWTLEQLTARLAASRQQFQGSGVLIRGDAAGRYQRVAEVLNACKQAGVAELGIAVKLADKRQAPVR